MMSVTDIMGDFDPGVLALGTICPAIDPFEMVVIRGSTNVTIWTGTDKPTIAV